MNFLSKSLKRKLVSGCISEHDYSKMIHTRWMEFGTWFLHQNIRFLSNFEPNLLTGIWLLHQDCRYVYTFLHTSTILPVSLSVCAYVWHYKCQKHFEPKVCFEQSINCGHLWPYNWRRHLTELITYEIIIKCSSVAVSCIFGSKGIWTQKLLWNG